MCAIEARGILAVVPLQFSSPGLDDGQNPILFVLAGVLTLFAVVAYWRKSHSRPVRRHRTVELCKDEFVFNPAGVYRMTHVSPFQQSVPMPSVDQYGKPLIHHGKAHIKTMIKPSRFGSDFAGFSPEG